MLEAYFKTTRPAVHGMVAHFENKGFIEKQAIVPRSIRLLPPREELPDVD
jgi:hypothetical protein